MIEFEDESEDEMPEDELDQLTSKLFETVKGVSPLDAIGTLIGAAAVLASDNDIDAQALANIMSYATNRVFVNTTSDELGPAKRAGESILTAINGLPVDDVVDAMVASMMMLIKSGATTAAEIALLLDDSLSDEDSNPSN